MNTKKSVHSVISLALVFAVIICSFSGCKFKRLSKMESITQIFDKASENMSETAAMSASSNISVTHKRFNVTTNDTIASDASYIRDKDSYSDYYINQTIDKGETYRKRRLSIPAESFISISAMKQPIIFCTVRQKTPTAFRLFSITSYPEIRRT